MHKYKRFLIVISTIVILITGLLSYLNLRPINFVIKDYKIDNNIVINSDKVSLFFRDFKFHIEAPKFIVSYNDQKIRFNEVKLIVHLWLITSNFSAKVDNANLPAILDKDFAKYNTINFKGDVFAKLFLTTPKKVSIKLSSKDGYLKRDNGEIDKLKDAIIDVELKRKFIKINNLKIEYDNGFNLSTMGNLEKDGVIIQGIKLKAKAFSLPVNDIKYFWPNNLYPEIKEWVANNVYGGEVEQVTADFNITKKDIENKKCTNDAINTNIIVKNTNLTYINEKKPIQGINSKVHIDCSALEAEADSSFIHTINFVDIKFRLPFDTLKLEVKSKFRGSMEQLSEFIPLEYNKKMTSFGMYIEQPNSLLEGDLFISYPITQVFSFPILSININANINNFYLGKANVIKISQANIKIANDEDKFEVKILNNLDKLDFTYRYLHKGDTPNKNYGELNLSYKVNTPINFPSFEIKSGLFKVYTKYENDIIDTKFDATEAELYLPYIGYTKGANESFKFECISDLGEVSISSRSCTITGKNKFSAKVNFVFDKVTQELSEFNLQDVKIDKNVFSVDIQERNKISLIRIKSDYIDLSNFDPSKIPAASSDGSLNFAVSFDVKKMLAKNNIAIENIKGEISKNGINPVSINLSAKSDDGMINISRALKNGKQIYLLHATNIARFLNALDIYKNIKKGEAWIELAADKNANGYIYSGNIKLMNFYFSNRSALTKVIRGILAPIHSFSEIVESLKGGSLPADNFTSKLTYADEELNIIDGFLKGSFYEVKIAGFMNFKEKRMKFKGLYIPNFHGINGFISSIPILGQIISGGKDSALIGANFSIKGNFDNPETFFNPLSLLTPGFLRNLL